MAGYAGFSMSNNAVDAYDRGLLPASKIGRGIPASLIARHVGHEEWHHSSKHFNEVRFYDPARVLAAFGVEPHPDHEPDPEAIAALAAHKAARADAPNVHTGCTVEWLDWGGTRKHPRAYPQRATGCTVAIKGQTATITLPSGSTFQKRLTTNGFRWSKEG